MTGGIGGGTYSQAEANSNLHNEGSNAAGKKKTNIMYIVLGVIASIFAFGVLFYYYGDRIAPEVWLNYKDFIDGLFRSRTATYVASNTKMKKLLKLRKTK